MFDMIDIRYRLGSAEVRDLVDQLEYPAEIRERKTAEILKEYQEQSEQPILAVNASGKLVAFIGLRFELPHQAIIRHIAVHRSHRGQGGIGTQMILYVCSTYCIHKITAETDRDAVEFYRKVGFEVQSLGEKYPGTERFLCRLTGVVQQPAEGDWVDRTP
jgi:ribosomal protein S18 acetylase RimI-like enzyme